MPRATHWTNKTQKKTGIDQHNPGVDQKVKDILLVKKINWEKYDPREG
jgi:hypothetical protein